jgi:outer membrane protein assembly factor BamB
MSRAPGPRSTPLVLDDLVITTGATGKLRAVDKKTGTLAWKALDFKISYASPILIEAGGQTQAVLVMESQVIGIDPRNGALLWQHPHANNTRTNVSTPVWGNGDLLFVSSAYSSVGRVLHLARQGDATDVHEVWTSRDLRVHVANAVRIGDTLYGSSGDFGPSFFRAVDVKSGTVLWEDRTIGKSSFVNAGGRFVMLNEDGELILAQPEADGLKVLARAQVMTKTAWTPPSMDGGVLYLRDKGQLAAFDLK